MAATWAMVVTYAPELSVLAVGVQNAYLDLASRLTNHQVFTADADVAESLMAAHLATLMKQGAMGGSGPVTNVSVGGVSVGFATPMEAQATLQLTSYGKMLRMFQRTKFLTPMLTG